MPSTHNPHSGIRKMGFGTSAAPLVLALGIVLGACWVATCLWHRLLRAHRYRLLDESFELEQRRRLVVPRIP